MAAVVSSCIVIGATPNTTYDAAGALLGLRVGSDLFERLGHALKCIGVGGLGAAAGFTLDHQIGTFAHGLDHLRLFGGVLYPGAVVLGVHDVIRRADGRGGIVVGL